MSLRKRRSAVAAGAFLLAVATAVAGTLWYSHSTSTPRATPARAGIDFANDQDANFAAAQGNLSADLARFDNFAIAQIVSSGIEVDLVGPPTAAILAVVARDDPQYQGKPIPVSYRSVRHTRRELEALIQQIEDDRAYWEKQGIQLTSWVYGASNLIEITLAHYTKAYGEALIARYGADWVTVHG
ncbi:MAG TPA: hypothetical protein VJ851_08685 [Jatrophihabitans sp.]|nr:hypothetical protein [Jatrophihabitans sp.]